MINIANLVKKYSKSRNRGYLGNLLFENCWILITKEQRRLSGEDKRCDRPGPKPVSPPYNNN